MMPSTTPSGARGQLLTPKMRSTAAGGATCCNVGFLFQKFCAPAYPQLFAQHAFIPNLAAVDAPINCGPEGAGALLAAVA